MDAEVLLFILTKTGPDARTILSHVLESSARRTFCVWAENAPFDKKDVLKKEKGYTITQAAAVLRESSVRATDSNTASFFASAYAEVAAKLTDPSAIAQESAVLRGLLVRERNSKTASNLAQAYAIVAAKLTDPSAIAQEAAVLRERLIRESNSDIASNLAQAYATAAAELTDPSAIAQEAAVLRERLVHATNSAIVHDIALAYAVVAKKIVEDAAQRADKNTLATRVGQVLTMAGHPFLGNAKSLLSAVEPASGNDFGSDVGAAVKWWVKEFRGDPATLRP